MLCLPAPTAEGQVTALNNEGIKFYEKRLYHQAIDRFRKALELREDDAEVKANLALAWVGLGLEFLNSGESAPAEKAFQSALEVQEEPYAYFGLGYIHYLQQDDRGARRALERVLRLDATFARAYKILGLLEYRNGREDKAEELMARAVELDKDDREAESILQRWRQHEKIAGKFKTRKTKRLRLRYDPELDRETLRDIEAALEKALQAVGEALGVWPQRRLSVTLFSEQSFRQATGAAHWIGGLFDGQIKIPVPTRATDGTAPTEAELAELSRALHHELTHALLKELYPAVPNWLNEGVAQFFEFYPHPDDDAATLGRAVEFRRLRRKEAVAQLREHAHQRVSLAKIPVRLWEQSDEARARWTYLQGLSFVDYLVDTYHLFRLRVFLKTARDSGSLQSACRLTYGRELEKLEDDWWKSVLARE